MTMPRRVVLLTGLALASSVAAAQTPSPAITVEEPWMRAALQGGTGGAFLTLRNAGAQPDRLVGASSPAARAVEIHATTRQGDIMRMQPVQAVEIPAGGSVALQPGGLHIMLVGLGKAAQPGTSLPLTLVFEQAGPVAVQVPVRAAGAQGPSGAGGHAHH